MLRLHRRTRPKLPTVFRHDPQLRRGLTLVEIMVSVTLSLLLVLALVQVFGLLGTTISDGRAKMELATRLRRASNLLQRDLDSHTCPVKPWIDPDAGAGYFEYVEGISRDYSIDGNFDEQIVINAQSPDIFGPSHLGDLDDVVFMTVRSETTPFRGRGPNGTIESTMAEVVWWVAFLDVNNNNQLDTTDSPMLMRRVLLIRPDALDNVNQSTSPLAQGFFANYDISARLEFDASGSPYMVANSMSDLANRRNRFAHQIQTINTESNPFPNRVQFLPWVGGQIRTPRYYFANVGSNSVPMGVRTWSFLPRLISHEELANEAADWFVTSDLLAFDIRGYDPQAPVYRHSATSVAIVPGDYGFQEAVNNNWDLIGLGAYVDLASYNISTSTLLQNPQLVVAGNSSNPEPPLPTWGSTVSYDTWSLGYERDGINQDRDRDQNGNHYIDEGTNGRDDPDHPNAGDNPDGLVDDIYERETQPPYEVPLRGLEVRLRAIDLETRQVRQTSVVGDFTR